MAMPAEGFGRRLVICGGLLLYGVVTVSSQYMLFHAIQPHLKVQLNITSTSSEILAVVGSLLLNIPLLAGAAMGAFVLCRRGRS